MLLLPLHLLRDSAKTFQLRCCQHLTKPNQKESVVDASCWIRVLLCDAQILDSCMLQPTVVVLMTDLEAADLGLQVFDCFVDPQDTMRQSMRRPPAGRCRLSAQCQSEAPSCGWAPMPSSNPSAATAGEQGSCRTAVVMLTRICVPDDTVVRSSHVVEAVSCSCLLRGTPWSSSAMRRFDGKGMVHAVRMHGDTAHYSNRYVRTHRFLNECAVRFPLHTRAHY